MKETPPPRATVIVGGGDTAANTPEAVSCYFGMSGTELPRFQTVFGSRALGLEHRS